MIYIFIIINISCISNTDGMSKSEDIRISQIDFERGLSKIKEDTTLGTTYLISIGIDTYISENWHNLRYAVSDAKGIYDSFPELNNKLLIINENATKANIEKSILHFLNVMKEQDVLIIYIANHGLMDENDHYFIPHDGTMEMKDGKAILNNESNISSDWLNKLLFQYVKYNSLNFVLILDSCNSGSMGFDIRRSYNANTGAGAILFFSCSPLEYSFEMFSLQHGVFTFEIIEGLRGNADKNKDGKITFRELYDYVYSRVQSRTNGKQNPALIGAMRSSIIIKENY